MGQQYRNGKDIYSGGMDITVKRPTLLSTLKYLISKSIGNLNMFRCYFPGNIIDACYRLCFNKWYVNIESPDTEETNPHSLNVDCLI